MSRRRGGKPAGIQMFPFLAVLICTMGALVVLLHAFARHGQEQAIKTARSKADANSDQQKMDAEDVAWRIGHLREARAKTEAQLADERLKLSHVEDHQRRLREKLAQLEIAAGELEGAAEEKSDKQDRGAAELAGVKARLDEAKKARDAALGDGRNKSVSYSVVPYEGRNATRRRPIYIECRESLIVLQPEGIELSPRDFVGFFGPGNPLAAAVRAKREYLAGQSPQGAPAEEPYPLLLVRPEGVAAYYAARAALDSWGSEFGYELVGSDWTLKFPPPDPQLVALTRKVVAEARLRHREYTLTSPQVAKSRSRPVYRARAHGGFAPVAGGGGSAGPGGRGGGGWNDFAGDWASGGDSRAGGDSAAGGDPYAEFDGGRGRSAPGAAADLQDPYGDSSDGGGGTGSQGLHPGGQNAGGPGKAPYAQRDPDAAGTQQGVGPSAAGQPGEPGTEPPFAQSQNQGTGASGSPSSAQSGSQGDQHGQNGQSAEALVELPHPGGGGNGPPSHSATPSSQAAVAHRKSASMASTRGSDWGLPESSAGAVAATRPVLVECYADRLFVLPESRGMPPEEIRLTARTEDSMDELVSAVWDHMKSWGKAGKGLYWRPTLSMNVQPGAANRFAEIQALLADSGLDVHQRQRRPAAAPATTRRR
jgi:hypothetical protein